MDFIRNKVYIYLFIKNLLNSFITYPVLSELQVHYLFISISFVYKLRPQNNYWERFFWLDKEDEVVDSTPFNVGRFLL